MSPYILLCISVVLAVANNVLLHGVKSRGCKGLGDVLLFKGSHGMHMEQAMAAFLEGLKHQRTEDEL